MLELGKKKRRKTLRSLVPIKMPVVVVPKEKQATSQHVSRSCSRDGAAVLIPARLYKLCKYCCQHRLLESMSMKNSKVVIGTDLMETSQADREHVGSCD
jgi:hypothetical protein